MEVNETLIDQLALLARMEFTREEKISLQDDLARMIGFVEKLQTLDVEGIAPLLHMSDRVNNFREDHVSNTISTSTALKNAPEQDGIFFKVPKVINK